MPKAQRWKEVRPSAPYNIRQPNTNQAQHEMGDPYMTMPQPSPVHWGGQQYQSYGQPNYISSNPEYPPALLTPGLHTSVMPTPAIPAPVNRHSRQPSQSIPWSKGEDTLLEQARKKGMGWSAIHENYFPSKSSNACRKRHERLQVKQRGTDWDDQRMENLAVKYKSMRDQIWQPLAEALGEKWDTVEKICMQQGVKTLTNKASNQARNQTRGHRRECSSSGDSGLRVSSEFDHSSSNDDFDDSGIGLGVRRSGRRQNPQYPASLGHILQDQSNPYVYS